MRVGRRRRALGRDYDREEREVIAVAREAVPRVRACFTTDPDEYDVRAAIVFRPSAQQRQDGPEFDVFQFQFDESLRTDYFMSGDASYLLNEVVPAEDEPAAHQAALAWVGDAGRKVEFNLLPGLYQTAFIGVVAGREPPFWPLCWMWVVPSDGEMWPVRFFPSGLGEDGPPIGEVGYAVMHRAAVQEIYRLRGW